MNRAELMVKIPTARRDQESRTGGSTEVADLFNGSLRRAMEDKESPAEIDESVDRAEVDKQESGVSQQQSLPVGPDVTATAASARESLDGKGSDPEFSANGSWVVQHAMVQKDAAFLSAKEKEESAHSYPGAYATGNTPFATGVVASHRQANGNTAAAASYQDFSNVLQQQMKEAGARSTMEWRFSFSDSRLPLSQVNLTAHSGGGWGVCLAASNFDREALARRLDELQLKLARLNQTIDAVEIVKERRR